MLSVASVASVAVIAVMAVMVFVVFFFKFQYYLVSCVLRPVSPMSFVLCPAYYSHTLDECVLCCSFSFLFITLNLTLTLTLTLTYLLTYLLTYINCLFILALCFHSALPPYLRIVSYSLTFIPLIPLFFFSILFHRSAYNLVHMASYFLPPFSLLSFPPLSLCVLVPKEKNFLIPPALLSYPTSHFIVTGKAKPPNPPQNLKKLLEVKKKRYSHLTSHLSSLASRLSLRRENGTQRIRIHIRTLQSVHSAFFPLFPFLFWGYCCTFSSSQTNIVP